MDNQITQLRLPDGQVVSFVDWTDRPLFSTIEFLAGTTTQEMNFFQYVVGDSVPAFAPVPVVNARTALEIDTNMASPGGMADTEEMLIYAVRPEVFRFNVESASLPDFSTPVVDGLTSAPMPTTEMLEILNARTLLSVEISQKVYAQAGFGYFNLGFGVVATAIATGNTTPTANNGWQSQDAVRTFALPMHIGSTEKFRVFMTYMDDGTGNGIDIGLVTATEASEGQTNDPTRYARIRVYLDGLYKRPTS